jgi:DNA mismatch repair protein MutL
MGFWGEADAVRIMKKAQPASAPAPSPAPFFDPEEESPASRNVLHEESSPELNFFAGLDRLPENRAETASQPRAEEKTAAAQVEKTEAPKIASSALPPDDTPAIPEVSPLNDFRWLGQVARTYLVFSQKDDALLILDQHAMHERIFYEKFRKGGSRGMAQPLLVPLELDLHPAESSRLLEIQDTLTSLGFELSKRDSRCFIHAMPPEMDRSEAVSFLREALSGRVDDLNSVWIHHACATAIRAGQHLTREDALKLVSLWLQTEEPDFCPHGRPCAVTLDKADL